MELPYVKINEILVKWASNNPFIEDFTVENMLFALGLNDTNYEEVYKYLMSKSGFELIPLKILLCPSNHKCDTFLLDEPVDEDEFYCFCQNEEFGPEKFILAFSFTDGFKSESLKKKMTFQSSYQMV